MSEVKVDTISERTTDGGVTIDGVLVKDGVATFQTAAGSPLVFEGATADAYETTFAITDPTADNTITFPDASFTVPTAGGLFESYSILTDEKTAGSAGGTFTTGAWRTRDLQNEVYDGIGITFSTNEFILPAGNYLIQWSAPAYSINLHKSRLYDVTGTAVIEYGSSEMASSLLGHYADVGMTRSFGSARVTPSGTNNYKIEHYCEDTYATEGFGHAGGFAVEVYTIVEIFKES